MCGGYPEATGYRLYAKNANMEEIVGNRNEHPLGDPDPSSGEFEKILDGEIVRKFHASIYPITLDNYDLVHWAGDGGPGYGDPLERNLDDVEKDLEDDVYSTDVVRNVYGVVAEYDEGREKWTVDEEATEEGREDIREERREKSVPFKEFYREEKEKIVEDKLSKQVKRMFKESIELSEKWGKEFLEFWDLPEDFELEVK